MNEDEKKLFDSMVAAYSGLKFDVKQAVIRQLGNLGVREDANESIMFARELEHVFAKTYDVQYPGLKARQLIPVNMEVPAGADSFTYQQYDYVGESKEIDDYATDFPTVEIKGAEFNAKVISLGNSYQYTTQDLRAAAMARKPLDAMKASAARRVMENKVEKIAARGSAARGLTGLLNAPNVPTLTLPTGGWATLIGTPTDANLSLLQADVSYMRNQIKLNTKTVWADGFTLLVDTTTKSWLETTPQGASFKDQSIETFLLRTVKGLTAIEEWLGCDAGNGTEGGDGANGPRLCMYPKNPDVLQLIVAQEFEQFPPQLLGMAFKIFCHMRLGPVQVRYPKAMAYADNHA